MTDPRLVLAWLVVAHLVAETILGVGAGRGATRRSAAHALLAGACALPVAVAFGGRGLAYVAIVVAAHLLIDAWLPRPAAGTGRAGDAGLPDAGLPATGLRAAPPGVADSSAPSLGPRWSSGPAAVLALGQGLHGVAIVAAWWVLLAATPVTAGAAAFVDWVRAGADPGAFHVACLVFAVATDLVLVNGPLAARFIALLLQPNGPGSSGDATPVTSRPGPAPGRAVPEAASPAPRGWHLHLGPLTAALTPDPTLDLPPARAATPRPGPAELRVGRAIGIFERALAVVLVLARAEAAVALIGGVKTIARFRQLEDRPFAEYYLLGTLASLTVGIGTALLARWWLGA